MLNHLPRTPEHAAPASTPADFADIIAGARPVVLRGAVADWPVLVSNGVQS